MAAKKKKKTAKKLPKVDTLNKSNAVRAYMSANFPSWIKTGKTKAMGTFDELSQAISQEYGSAFSISDISNQFTQLKRANEGTRKGPKQVESKAKPRVVGARGGAPVVVMVPPDAQLREAIAGAYADGYSAGIRARK